MSSVILIIEDHTDICENTAELLELAGYKVVTANNGKDGIESVRRHKPDLILCDIMMPQMDGYGVLYAIGNLPDVSGTPFVFLTAKSENSDIKKGIDLGACDYIVKPFENEELLRKVREKLRKEKLPDRKIENFIL